MLLLQFAKAGYPGKKIVLGHQGIEARELEMRVRVDQPGEDRGVRRLDARHSRGCGHLRLRSDPLDESVRPDEQRTALDGRCIDRQDPPGAQPDGRHASAAVAWERVEGRRRP